MSWFSPKRICSYCNDVKTHQVFEGQPACYDCEATIFIARESMRACLVDGNPMVKENVHKNIIDRCSKCQDVWLDHNELESLKEKSQQDSDFAQE
jgi:hypothetical protein